ncbi:bifunctional 2-polyprenyl-6-hydroxyphenol methylase/3-demethylubiquinol 3-O-methyltransferase UbiG [Chitinophaga sp. Cy-1792]|uniref:class I SAM-dependent methyltransferase n=1 Tax=Chitinophaga sp. Cy-1792 TaxID=2608339 RepID=UPI0014218EDD|nr:class I SAM-dependent methyltransferase [Chitinophaga sp. Cy-1792]NIG55888.1 class I SAM-dependent methyltransferase [Chitinophaga sp. Cy-1792]
MKENKYDDPQFFGAYSNMNRSQKGLEGAGEWHALKAMLPSFTGKTVLDLGCGFGWHDRYAIEQGATAVTGVDISEKMLARAREINGLPGISYIRQPIEDIHFPDGSFDMVISSLAFHYIAAFDALCEKVAHCLRPGGNFVFSVEHPVFTAAGKQDWYYAADGSILHWPVDHYFSEGERQTVFLGTQVTKYHRTLTTYLQTLISKGFTIQQVVEPQPDEAMLKAFEGMENELRRPMMLLISAVLQ